MANEGDIKLPSSPEEHLYMFVCSVGDVLGSAYGRMQHPMLKEFKDQLFFDDVMVGVGRLKKAMEARQGEPEGPSGKHIDKVVSRERIDAFGEDLQALLAVVQGITQKSGIINVHREQMVVETQAISDLGEALYARNLAEFRDEPTPRLTQPQEELLMKLWERYSDRVDESPSMQSYRLTVARADEIQPGIRALFDERQRLFEEHAVAQVAIGDYMAATNQIVDALTTLGAVQSAALGLAGSYMGTQVKQQGEDLPPKP